MLDNDYSYVSAKQKVEPDKNSTLKKKPELKVHHSQHEAPEGETSTKAMKAIAYIFLVLAFGIPVFVIVYAGIDIAANPNPTSITSAVIRGLAKSPEPMLIYIIPLLFFSIMLFVFSAISKNLIEMRYLLQTKLSGYFASEVDVYMQRMVYSLDETEKLDQKFDLLIEKLDKLSDSVLSKDINKFSNWNPKRDLPPAPTSFDQEMNIQDIIEQANTSFKENDFSGALKNYNKAILVNKNDFVLISKRANTHFMLKDYDKAIDDYNRAAKIKPDSGITCYYMGYAKLMKGERQTAKQDLEKALNLGVKQAAELLTKYCN